MDEQLNILRTAVRARWKNLILFAALAVAAVAIAKISLTFTAGARYTADQQPIQPVQEPRVIDQTAPPYGLFKDWATLVQCKSARVGFHGGWRVVLCAERNERVQRPSGNWWDVIHRDYVQLGLIPDTEDVSPFLKHLVWWEWLEHNEPVQSFYLGKGRGYHWFGRMSVPPQHQYRREFGLEGGDDEFKVLMGYLHHQRHERGYRTALYLLADLGERAIPPLEKEMGRALPEEQYDVARAMKSISGARSASILLGWYNKADTRRPAASALLDAPYLREAKPVYLNALQYCSMYGQGGFHAAFAAVEEFKWPEAVPFLKQIQAQPRYMWHYYTAFRLMREIEGKPMPPEVLEAVDTVLADCGHFPPTLTPTENARASETIVSCPDREAAVAAAVYVATAHGGKGGCRPQSEIGIDMLRRLPRQPVEQLLRLVLTRADRRSGPAWMPVEKALAALNSVTEPEER